MHVVIVGAGAAGISALDTIRKHDKKVKVTIVSESAPYSPFALAEYITGGVDKRKIQRFSKKHFADLSAKFVNRKVTKVDTKNRQIIINGGAKLKYDRLLLAQGSTPIKPPIPGIDNRGVFYLFTFEEAKKIKGWILKNKVRDATIIGAGFAGLEAAASLNKAGINVAIIEMLSSVLPKMIDSDVARKVERNLRSRGIKIFLKEAAEETQGNGRVKAVKTNKRKLKADVILVTVGVKPNLEILKGSRIKTNTGIIVDEKMETNVNGVFAAGDVVEFKDAFLGLRRINAIWPNAVQQARVAAYNILDMPNKYEGSDIVNIVDVFGIPVVAIGYLKSELKGCEEIVIKARDYIKILIQDNMIVGFQGIGNRAVKYGGLIHSLMKKKEDVAKLKLELKSGKLKNLFAEPYSSLSTPSTPAL